MSFEDGVKFIDSVINSFDKVRESALTSLPQSKLVAFDAVMEFLGRVRRITELSSLLEKTSEGSPVERVCGGWTLIKYSDILTLVRYDPFASITFDSRGREVSVSNDTLRLSVSPGNLNIKLWGKELNFSLGNPASLANNAPVIKSLISKVFNLTDYLIQVLETCVKLKGIRV